MNDFLSSCLIVNLVQHSIDWLKDEAATSTFHISHNGVRETRPFLSPPRLQLIK
jgi:hypothetical protein